MFFSSSRQYSKTRPTQRKRTPRSLSIELLEDRSVPSTFTVLNLNDSGAGSLRQALLNADSQSGADVINFSVAGTIQLTSGALPAITDNVDIDGTSAPGFAGTPLIEVDYNRFGGLLFNAGAAGSTLDALALVNASGAGVTVDGGGGVHITGNFIGVGLDGTTVAGNAGDGVALNASTGNVIGQTNPVTGVTYANTDQFSTQPVSAWQGIRGSDTSGQYLITGTSNANGLLFDGTMAGVGTSYFVNYPGATTTSVYGPNNLGGGNLQLVGSYKNADASTAAVTVNGFLFQGTTADLGQSANYQTIDHPGAQFNYVHSTMGGLVVGNYDSVPDHGKGNLPLGPGHAYLYDIAQSKFLTDIVFPGSLSNTAYGIWYNGGTSYTICGGYSPDLVNNLSNQNQPIGQGYMVDYDSVTGKFSNWTSFTDPAGSNYITHFESISSVEKGVYTLCANSAQSGSADPSQGSWVTVRRNADGSFGPAAWVNLNAPGYDPTSNITSSNSVYGNQVVGVVIGPGGTASYQATVNTGFQLSNVISGNGGNGIGLYGANNNQIAMNFIGTDATGTLARGNAQNGILMTAGATGNMIGGQATGGNDPTDGVFVQPPQGNLISGNAANGVLINGQATQNTLSGNFIGTARSGNSALGNTLDGVAINGADGNSLLGCTLTTNPFVFYNVIGGNGANGLRITNSNNTTVQGNFFGLGADNQTPVGNVLNGVVVEGSSTNTVMGGPIPLGNVDAANGQNGILVQDTASFFTSYNTFTGLAAFQTYTNLGNRADGMKITSTGGNILLRTNVITENGNDGIEISGAATGVRVAGNIIGLDTNGKAPMGNKNNGVEVDGSASNIVIGGPQLTFNIIPHNVISANGGNGVAIDGNANNVQVSFSFIGTALNGLDAFGNAKAGVLLGPGTSANSVGSADPSLFSVISGNLGDGVEMVGSNGNTVIGTLIGSDVTGLLPLPNGGNGVFISNGFDNVIGRSTSIANSPASLIAFNAANGVLVTSGSRNAIQQNSIYANALVGIDLVPGANLNQASPVLSAVRTSPLGIQVTGTLTSTPNSTFTIEFFGNTVNGTSGRFLLGSTTVATNAAGIGTFTFAGPLLPSGANFVTATATDAQNNTSAFSAVAPFNPLTLPSGTLPDATINIAFDQTITATGGTGADTFAVTAGVLPIGLSLNGSTGAITGRPTVAATANFTITVTDSLSASASQSYSLVVLPAAFVYNATTGVLTITGVHFSFGQATTANVNGISTLYTFTIDGVSQTVPDTAISSVVVNGSGAGSSAILVTNDTYVGTDNKTHETAEIASLGAAGVGEGQLLKFNPAGLPFVFLQLNNFNTSYAYVGKADSGLLYGAAGETNGFVTAGNYSYMSAPGYFHLIQGAPDLYGYSASPTDFAFHYDGSGPSTYRVDGTTQSYMSGTDHGASFFNVAEGFGFNTAVALHPRQDAAYFIDSTANDVFSANAKDSYMYSDNAVGNLTELDAAFGFATVFASSINGGTDQAYDSGTGHNIMTGAWFMLISHY